MTIDEFVADFIEKEFQALRAKYGELDPTFVPKLRAVNALFGKEVITRSGISRGSSGQLHPRVFEGRRVLGIRALSEKTYEAHLTGPDGGTEEAKFLIRESEVGFRIVGYSICFQGVWQHADGVER